MDDRHSSNSHEAKKSLESASVIIQVRKKNFNIFFTIENWFLIKDEIEEYTAPHYEYDEDPSAANSQEYLGNAHDQKAILNQGKTFQQILEEELAKEAQNGVSNGGPEIELDNKLSDIMRRENQSHIQVFGEEFVIKAFSKKHNLRHEAVEELKTFLTQDPKVLLQLRLESQGTRAEQRDILRASVSFLERFLEDGVKEVYIAALDALPQLFDFLVDYFPNQSDTNYSLEHILPILLRRAADGVHNLDKPPSRMQLKKINDFIERTVQLGTIEAVNKTPVFISKIWTPFILANNGPKVGVKPRPKGITNPKQMWARYDLIEKILKDQQRLIAKHWSVEQIFEETFRTEFDQTKLILNSAGSFTYV